MINYQRNSRAVLGNSFFSVVGIRLEIDSNLGQIIYMVDIEILDCIFFSFLLNSYVTSGGPRNGFFNNNIPEGLSMEK